MVISDGDDNLDISYAGDIRFDDAETTIQEISEGGYLNYRHNGERLLAGPERPRQLGLTEGEAAALTLFLRALDGEAIDPILATPPK